MTESFTKDQFKNEEGSERFRFAAVISHPIQHYVPVFRELARRPDFQVKVFYVCDWGVKPYYDPGFDHNFAWDIDLLAGYDHQFLPITDRPRHMGFWEIDAPEISKNLETFRPHAVWLHGYGHRVCWRAASWATQRAAVIHFGDSELVHARPLWRRVIKEPFLRWHFRRCDAFISIGDNNEAYYRHYGVPSNRIFRGACPIDVGRFRNTIEAQNRPSRADLRERYGFTPSDTVALWVGKLQASKRPADFLLAIKDLASEGVPVKGLMVGDGPLRDDIEQQAQNLGLGERLRIAGFVNQADLPLVFEAGDFFVTTSEIDPHPLVVTESMAVGLPVVASDRVGCVGASDTARPGVNAMIYPCGDTRALARCMHELVDGDLRCRLGESSYEIASKQGPDTTVRAVLRSLVDLHKNGRYDWSDVPSSTWDRIKVDIQHS